MLPFKWLGPATALVILIVYAPDSAFSKIDNAVSKVFANYDQMYLQQDAYTICQQLFKVNPYGSEYDSAIGTLDEHPMRRWNIFNTTPGFFTAINNSAISDPLSMSATCLSPSILKLIKNDSNIFNPSKRNGSALDKNFSESEREIPDASLRPITILLFVCVIVGLFSIHRHLKKFD